MMMDFSALAAVLAITSPIVWKVVEFAKYIRARDANAVLTQSIVWLAGIGAVFLLGSTDFAPGIPVGDLSLDKLNAASLLFIGVAGGAVASIGYDFKKAIDNRDTAVSPALLPDAVKVIDPMTGETAQVGAASPSTSGLGADIPQ